MDLVCRHGERWYLLDWKSNHLGNRVEAYGPDPLAAEMGRSLYPLQYLLYTVSLDRYLRLRVPDYDYDRHFGGVRYLFLRGVNGAAGPEYGVFSDRPHRALVAELAELLLESGASHG
jgi:exodeoxyribonuclease V beta subunit